MTWHEIFTRYRQHVRESVDPLTISEWMEKEGITAERLGGSPDGSNE